MTKNDLKHILIAFLFFKKANIDPFLTHTPPKSGLVHFFKLFPKRDAHTLWKRSDGIQLLGGRPFPLGNTSEVVTSSGSHKGFDLKYDIVYECYLNI